MGSDRRKIRDQLIAWLVILRPRQWLKNLAVFVGMFFAGQLFNQHVFSAALTAFVIFCLLSSSGYILNDIIDIETDRVHPFKKLRPLPAKQIYMSQALSVALLLAAGAIVLSWNLGVSFFLIAVGFWLIRLINTLFLRRVPLLDVLELSTVNVMRVYAGVAATGSPLSSWLAISIFSLALLLAIGKRRAEFTLLADKLKADNDTIWTHYSEKMLNTYVALFATATLLAYAYYAFLVGPVSGGLLPKGVVGAAASPLERKWLMVTIPLVVYGIMRYLQLVYEEKSDTLEKILTADKPLIATGIIWAIVVAFIIYGIGKF